MNPKNSIYPRTDLACEAAIDLENIEGTKYTKKLLDVCSVEKLTIISSAAEQALKKKRGSYITLKTAELWKIYDEELDSLADATANELRELICLAVKRNALSASNSVLIVGLGNAHITADAIGPETIRRLTVTRHIKKLDISLFKKLEMCEVAAISPGVLGETGIESAELIKAAADKISPELVIVIDALAAGSTERLARTIQISDTGINPGAGIGNIRCELSRSTLGLPVIALGVPTVVDTSSVVYDAICRVGADNGISNILREHLKSSERFYVTPKESDIMTEKVSVLLARSISKALGIL